MYSAYMDREIRSAGHSLNWVHSPCHTYCARSTREPKKLLLFQSLYMKRAVEISDVIPGYKTARDCEGFSE